MTRPIIKTTGLSADTIRCMAHILDIRRVVEAEQLKEAVHTMKFSITDIQDMRKKYTALCQERFRFYLHYERLIKHDPNKIVERTFG